MQVMLDFALTGGREVLSGRGRNSKATHTGC